MRRRVAEGKSQPAELAADVEHTPCYLCGTASVDHSSSQLVLDVCGHRYCGDCYFAWMLDRPGAAASMRVNGAFECPLVSCEHEAGPFTFTKSRVVRNDGVGGSSSAGAADVGGAGAGAAHARSENAGMDSSPTTIPSSSTFTALTWRDEDHPYLERNLPPAKGSVLLRMARREREANDVANADEEDEDDIPDVSDDTIVIDAEALDKHDLRNVCAGLGRLAAYIHHSVLIRLKTDPTLNLGSTTGHDGGETKEGAIDARKDSYSALTMAMTAGAASSNPVATMVWGLVSGNMRLPTLEDLTGFSGYNRRYVAASAAAVCVIAGQVTGPNGPGSNVGEHPLQHLLTSMVDTYGGVIPRAVKNLLVRLTLASKQKPAPPPQTIAQWEAPRIPRLRHRFSISDTTFDNIHFFGRGALELTMFGYHQYTPENLISMGFMEAVPVLQGAAGGGGEGGGGPVPRRATRGATEEYVQRMLKRTTPDDWADQFPDISKLFEVPVRAWEHLDEAEEGGFKESVKLLSTLLNRGGEPLVEKIAACSLEAVEGLAAQVNGDNPLLVATNPTAGVVGSGDTRSYKVARPEMHPGLQPGVSGLLERMHIQGTDIQKINIGSRRGALDVAYQAQLGAGVGDVGTLGDFVTLPPDHWDYVLDETFPDTEAGRRARAILTNADTARSTGTSDGSPIRILDVARCADENGLHLGAFEASWGGFHLLKADFKSKGDRKSKLFLNDLLKWLPETQTETKRGHYYHGMDPRFRWLLEPQLALGVRMAIAEQYRRSIKEDASALATVSWRNVYTYFDAQCRTNPSLWPVRHWLREVDTSSMLRGSGKVYPDGDFELFRALLPITAMSFSMCNSYNYVRLVLSDIVRLSTCSPFMYCVRKHLLFTTKTERGNSRFKDEGQEKLVQSGRFASSSPGKRWTRFTEAHLRERVQRLDELLRQRKQLSDTPSTTTVGDVEDEGYDGEAEDDAREEHEDATDELGGDPYRREKVGHVTLAAFAWAMSLNLASHNTSLQAANGTTIEQGRFMSLHDGKAINLSLLAEPRIADDRLRETASLSFPLHDNTNSPRIVKGHVLGTAVRAGETTRHAALAVNAKESAAFDGFYIKQQTSQNPHEIEFYRLGTAPGKLFTTELICEELARLKNTADAGGVLTKQAALDAIPHSTYTALHGDGELQMDAYSKLLADTRAAGIPCSPALKMRQPAPTVAQLADQTFTFGGVAFDPWTHRFVKNERGDEGETFDLTPADAGNDEDENEDGGGDGAAGAQNQEQHEMPGQQQEMQGPLVGEVGALGNL